MGDATKQTQSNPIIRTDDNICRYMAYTIALRPMRYE